MSFTFITSLLCLLTPSIAQTFTGVVNILPEDVAFLTNNITAHEQEDNPFQIYDSVFAGILGPNAFLSLIVTADFPAFHEAGVVTSLDPIVLYSSSDQFNTSVPSPDTNNKTIVVSRTVQNATTGEWTSEIVQNDTFPLVLANGGFQYQSGILFVAQGTLTESAGLVYLPTNPTPSNSTRPISVLDNYLGLPFNSPNDVYVTKDSVIYFTDPQIGYAQSIRPKPKLQNQVFGFVPNTTEIKVVAGDFGAPNGITFSPDEKTVYITDTGDVVSSLLSPDSLPGPRTIYAFDVSYSSSSSSSSSPVSQSSIAEFTNRRIFAVPAVGYPDGIKCDTKGNVWVGCGDGLNVFNPRGVLIGKVIVDGGVANFGFASDGRILVMAEKNLWLLQVDPSVQPAVPVGELRG